MVKTHPRLSAGLSILLIVSAASLGMAARLFIPNSIGQALLILTRIGMMILPLIWVFGLEQPNIQLSLNLPRPIEIAVGLLLGALMFAAILGAYEQLGQQWIDPATVQLKAEQMGITSISTYLLGCLYFTAVNSLIEEYIWRWFLYRQCEVLLPTKAALILAAVCFMLHHTLALAIYVGQPLVIALGSLGVFTAGLLWSWCYLTYRSLWAGYISHAFADLAIALVGWHILFRSL